MDQRNLIIAIALSIAILLGFNFFFEPPRPQRDQAQRTEQASSPPTGTATNGAPPTGTPTTGTPTTGTPTAGIPTAASTSAPSAGAAPVVESREAALAQAPRIKIDTPRLHGSIALVGGRIDDLSLADYHETADPKSPEIVLLSPPGSEHPYVAEFGWVPDDKSIKVPAPDTLWSSTGGALTPEHAVDLSWDNGAGLHFVRHYEVDANYMFTMTEHVENTGQTPVVLHPYGLVSRTGTPRTLGYMILHEGMVGVFNGVTNDSYSYKDLTVDKPVEFASTGGWLGITDKYWLTALVPDQGDAYKARFVHTLPDRADRYQADFFGNERVVPPGGSAESKNRFFGGPKVVKLLERYRDELHIVNFDYAVDWGYFWFLTKPIFTALDYIYGVVGNFGIAILLLTVCVKLLFFPLANKSYKAMSKMKLLQPEMVKLREKYGDDKARLNEEMMALYKRVGANPLAGCLPIVVQIPVFFSLYKVLFVTIEMRHAPFYGWIHDLSSPDPTSIVNLFGLLPFDPHSIPVIGAAVMIGAWPLIMGGTMFLQQKLNPQPADPIQAKMFMFLPIVFTYMLASFPAGLVIYWAWNNTLSVLQQWVIMRRAGAA
jgi:YidC/Oxa1 family membrane protein insertase